ncbi:hypothetical protein ACU4GD_03045 [Cupriavidus basilensis]
MLAPGPGTLPGLARVLPARHHARGGRRLVRRGPAGLRGRRAQADSLKREALIRLAFPGWRDDDKGRVVRARLPDQEYGGKGEAPLVEDTIDVQPIQVIRLDDTHAVMLTEGVTVDEGGTRNDSHAAGAWLGA